MAGKKYKPYKAATKDIYAKYDKKNDDNNYKNDSIKVFGLRSGKSYKMIPALLYYSFAALFIGLSIYGEFDHLKFETIDVVLEIFKYFFIIVAFFSPIIFLSDFKYVEKLPLFKRKSAGTSTIGIILVVIFCYFMMQVNIYCFSDTYRDSLKEYEDSLRVTTEQTTTGIEEETTTDYLIEKNTK